MSPQAAALAVVASSLDPRRLVFMRDLDQDQHGQFGGWGPKVIACEVEPHGHLAHADFLGALRLLTISPLLASPFDGPITTANAFRAYVEQQVVSSASSPRHRHHGHLGATNQPSLRLIKTDRRQLCTCPPYAT